MKCPVSLGAKKSANSTRCTVEGRKEWRNGESKKLERLILSGDPLSRGLQYGRKAKKLVEKEIEIYHSLFLESLGVTWDRAIGFSKSFVKRIKDYDEEILDEIRGIAKGAGRSLEEILTINLRTEILFGIRRGGDGCTSFSALPKRPGGERPSSHRIGISNLGPQRPCFY